MMTVKELKAYLNSIPEDTNIIIKDLEGELIVEDVGLNKVPSLCFNVDTMKGTTKDVLQLEIFVGR